MPKIITEFIYNNKIYFASKLDKKLKKLNITKDDITIVQEFEEIDNNKQIKAKTEMNDINTDIQKYYFYNIITTETIVSIYNNLNNLKWNPETKTGIKYINDTYINNCIKLQGKPKYPIKLNENNIPIIETF